MWGMHKPADSFDAEKTAKAEDVLELVHAVMHLYRANQYRSGRGAAEVATHMEGKVLGFLSRYPGATQSELTAHTARDKGQLARLVAGLRERGLLEAFPDENDRRSMRLHLTKDGEAARQALRRQSRRLSAAAVQGFSEAERQDLVRLLDRMHANLAAMRSD
jgi:DNA-binding MarR family transcriptional regulator